ARPLRPPVAPARALRPAQRPLLSLRTPSRRVLLSPMTGERDENRSRRRRVPVGSGPMTITTGEKVPDVEVFVMGPEGGPQKTTTGELLGSGRVVLFAVPG